MFNFFAKVFGYFLNIIYGFVGNYGIAIILFTLILKGVMLPISIKQQKTMKKTAKIQKEAQEIQKKFSNDQVRQSQELMDLYKRENMSPFSGCLGTIIQFVLILSMFYLVSRPLTYMKNIDPTIITSYEEQLKTANEGKNINYREIAIIRNFGTLDEKVNLNMNFLGLDLSDIPSQNYANWKVYIIPVLYVTTSLISTRLTMSMSKAKEDKEKIEKEVKAVKAVKEVKAEETEDTAEAMEEMQKQMNMMMPIMTVSIALIAPLGLALYWLVSNLLMICERLIIDKVCKEEEVKDGE